MDATDPSKEPRELLDHHAIDRIVAATNTQLCSDREALWTDLIECYRAWCLLSDFGRSAAKKGIKRLTRLHGWAAEGVRLLKDDDHGHARELWASHGGGYPALLPQIERLCELLEMVNLECAEYDGSPLENLLGVLLPDVFRRHFNRSARVSRNPDTGKLNGPYIRFAEQVCAEFDIRCERETVASAMRRHRAKPGDK